MPATSAAQNRLLFFFFTAAVYSTNEANSAGLKQSIFLDVYDSDSHSNFKFEGKIKIISVTCPPVRVPWPKYIFFNRLTGKSAVF